MCSREHEVTRCSIFMLDMFGCFYLFLLFRPVGCGVVSARIFFILIIYRSTWHSSITCPEDTIAEASS